ncbi:MAG: LysR family transcriptional regulator [Rhodoblastus sp.]|nr:LysR family transcriptional regulator [Rhodoblastus sp.]
MIDADWDLYRSFLAVLRAGSLSSAARQTASTQPTIGRHVDALERRLGAPLFTRSRAGLTPTPAAIALQPHAEAMEAAAAALERAAVGARDAESGVVRITASEIMGAEVLPPMLADVSLAHPRIAIELVLDNRLADLMRRDADIAVRMTRPTQGAILARRIGAVQIGLYAHRRYIARAGAPRTLAEASRHAAIGYDRDQFAVRRLGEEGVALDRDFFRLRSDSDCAQLALLRAGAGIGSCQRPLARRAPDLVPVLPNDISFTLDVWLAMHEDLKASRTVRIVYDALAKGLADYIREG